MRFIRGDSLKEAIDRFHGRAGRAATRRRGRWSSGSCCGRFVDVCNAIGLRPQPGRPPPRPQARATSCSGPTARPWSSTGAWPRPSAATSRRRTPAERAPCGRRSAAGSAETLPGLGHRHAGVHEPRAGRAASSTSSARPATSTASAPPSIDLLTGRPPFDERTTSSVLLARSSGASSRRPGRSTRRVAAGRWRPSA